MQICRAMSRQVYGLETNIRWKNVQFPPSVLIEKKVVSKCISNTHICKFCTTHQIGETAFGHQKNRTSIKHISKHKLELYFIITILQKE